MSGKCSSSFFATISLIILGGKPKPGFFIVRFSFNIFSPAFKSSRSVYKTFAESLAGDDLLLFGAHFYQLDLTTSGVLPFYPQLIDSIA